MRKKLAHSQCSSFFFLSVYITEASRKSNLTVWGEWIPKKRCDLQAVEVFEWDCGCLTSAGFYRYRCRRCCWFFCSQGHFTKRSKSYKKKLKKRKDGLGLCSLYLYTWISWESHKNLVRISWESRENLVRSSWDHCTLMRISWENFSLVRISWESHENSVQASISIFRVFMRKRPNMLMRISWHSHEILMRKRSNFHVKKKDSRESHEKPNKLKNCNIWAFPL